MENDELPCVHQLGFDEQAETWFLDTTEIRRLVLTRSTLSALVQLYNRFHRGNPLFLGDRRTLLRRFRDEGGLPNEPDCDLYGHGDRGRPPRVGHRATRLLARFASFVACRRSS